MKARDRLNKAVSETDFQKAVIRLATLQGWLVNHQRPAQNRRGEWSTPIQGHKGYPDLTLVRDRRIIFAELKKQGAYPSPEQKQWLSTIETVAQGCPLVAVYVWRPSDWDTIENVLTRRGD